MWALWGSWLTAIGHTLITGTPLNQMTPCDGCTAPRSLASSIPLISWLKSRGICPNCQTPFSYSYLAVPIVSAVAFSALNAYAPDQYLAAYFFFFSTLLITIFTDAQYMLISRFATVYLLPVPVIFAMLGFLPISPEQVMLGALSGYLILAGISYLFSAIMKKQGMGQGDIDLLCYIGAFLGFGGWWISLLVASCVGSVVGIMYLIATGQDKQAKIPFGPFLALGAMVYTLWGEWLFAMLFPSL